MLEAPLHATDVDSLARIEDLLHDEMFDFARLTFDAEAHVVIIPVRRQLHSGPERLVEEGWFVKTYEKDWIGGLLTLRGVRSWEAGQDQRIGTYSLFSLQYVNGGLEIAACEVMVLRFYVDGINVEYAETGVVGKAHIKRGPFGGMGLSSKVYG
jgi:hypothetical protein